MSHILSHIILHSTINRPDGIEIAISVPVPRGTDVSERAEVLQQIAEKLEGVLDE